MVIFFYTFLIVFIWTQIYGVINKIRLDTNFKNKDIKSVTKLDFIYYLTKFLYWVWILVGLFSSLWILFLVLLILEASKFPLYHLNKIAYIVWDNLLPAFSVMLISAILLSKLIF